MIASRLLLAWTCLFAGSTTVAAAAEAVATAPPATAKGAGQGGDPIVVIGKKMEEVANRLSQSSRKADPQIAQLQRQIIEELNALLKQLQKQAQQASAGSSPSGGGGKQQDKRTSVGGGSPAQANKPAAGNGQDSESPSRESSQRVGKAAPKVNLVELLQVVKDVWGHLPEKDRERLRQHSADQVVPGHDLAVEQYFRRLAEESRREDPER